MLTTFSLLRQFRGRQVYAAPAVVVLALLVLIDSVWPDISDRQERIDLLERSQATAQHLIDQRPELDVQVKQHNATLSEQRMGSFVSEQAADAQSQFEQWVMAQLAPMNLVNLSVAAAPGGFSPAQALNVATTPEANQEAKASNARVLGVSVSFDASPSQMDRAEHLLVDSGKHVVFRSAAATRVGSGPPGTGRLNVSYQLQVLYLHPDLF